MSTTTTTTRARRSSTLTKTVTKQPTWSFTLLSEPTAPAAGKPIISLRGVPRHFTPKPDLHLYPASQIHQQPQSTLLGRLPAEIRCQIYSYLLSSPASAHVVPASPQHHPSPRAPPLDLHPAILRVCRKAHHEALPLLYADKTFTAHPGALLTSFPHFAHPSRRVLLPQPAQAIRRWRVDVRLDAEPPYALEEVARAFAGAESLEMRAWKAGCEEWRDERTGKGVLERFEGVRGVRRVRVLGVEEHEARRLEGLMSAPSS